MTRIPQTEQELKIQLQNQLHLLAILANTYDAGHYLVAKSMATSVRVLVHDTQNSHSLQVNFT